MVRNRDDPKFMLGSRKAEDGVRVRVRVKVKEVHRAQGLPEKRVCPGSWILIPADTVPLWGEGWEGWGRRGRCQQCLQMSFHFARKIYFPICCLFQEGNSKDHESL